MGEREGLQASKGLEMGKGIRGLRTLPALGHGSLALCRWKIQIHMQPCLGSRERWSKERKAVDGVIGSE